MKAVVLRNHVSVENLTSETDHPRPEATSGKVVLKVRASSLNYHDIFTVRGMPGIKIPMPVVPGLDLAGEIVEVGPDTSGVKAGDRVLVNPLDSTVNLMGAVQDGGLAEYAVADAAQIIPLPAS
ncbi:MAG: alcohol dehydrogenase catalytic domain-containing protein, partial [Ancrocorticia sp.]|nr:alcohol dehydrogenase catalytic domain-containing protein [Ancrocorticia sp.]